VPSNATRIPRLPTPN